MDDWRYDVANGDTRLGFADWCAHNATDEDDLRAEWENEVGEGDCNLTFEQWLAAKVLAEAKP